MKDPKNMKTFGAEQALFLEKLSDLVTEVGFKGPIKGEPKMTSAGEAKLNLEQIMLNRIMMGFVDHVAQTLHLGADPLHIHHGMSMRQFNDAFVNLHGNKEHQKMEVVLEQCGVPKKAPTKTPKNRPTKN